jgi:hypothetical protein
LTQAYGGSFLNLHTRGDTVTVLLLDGTDTLHLETIIANFAVDPSYNMSLFVPITNYPSPENKAFFANWQMLSFFTFSGTLVTGVPNQIEIFASVSEAASSGSVRLYDATNRVTIAEQVVLAKSTNRYTLTVPDAIWPRDPAVLEVHCKVAGATLRDYIVVNALTIS